MKHFLKMLLHFVVLKIARCDIEREAACLHLHTDSMCCTDKDKTNTMFQRNYISLVQTIDYDLTTFIYLLRDTRSVAEIPLLDVILGKARHEIASMTRTDTHTSPFPTDEHHMFSFNILILVVAIDAVALRSHIFTNFAFFLLMFNTM